MVTKRKKATPKPNETAHERFQRLAPPRVEAAVKKIELLGNFGRGSYEYTPDEVKQIFTAIDTAIENVKHRLGRKTVGAKKGGFTFKSASSNKHAEAS